jgi:nucleotide-binding universal stress UspA family protein
MTTILCFDGSLDAAAAIAAAGRLLAPRRALVVTVWEPVRVWEPYDPATVISGPLSKYVSKELGLDQVAEAVARKKAEHGMALAVEAGFDATMRVERGKAWRVICRIAEEVCAESIVLGARGLGRVGSVLLGSVSSAVVVHARRPVLVVPHGDGGSQSVTSE